MKEKASPKRLKGTVLFTVVSVMMVLIVFLMGTLALAATASNRAASNYQKAQTEATARTVIDSVVQAVNDNADIRATVAALGDNASVDVTVKGSDGIDVDATITNVGTPQPMFDEGEQEWHDGKLFQVTTTVGKTKAETTYSAYFSAVIPQTLAPSAGGGAFVSLGDMDGQEIATGGYITGGTYININGPISETINFNANGQTIIDAPFYLNGNMNKSNKIYFHYRMPGDFFVVTGDFNEIQANGLATDYEGFTGAITSYDDIPYFYVGKKLRLHSKNVNFGRYNGNPNDPTNIPFNIFCGALELTDDIGNDGSFQMYGDLYCFEETDPTDPTAGKSIIRNTNYATELYKWAGSTLKNRNGNNAMGNWYSAGDVTIDCNNSVTFRIDGDLRVEGNVEIENKSGVNASGDVVSGKTLKIGTNATLECKNVCTDTLVVNGTLKCDSIKANTVVGTGTIECPDIQYVAVSNGTGVPTGLPGAPTYTNPRTVKEMYGNNDIYPVAYKATNIVDTVLTKPTITDYTNYPDEPSDLGPGIYSVDHFVIPEYTEATLPKETRADGSEISNLAIVTQSCVLSGPFNSSIYIDPESGPVTVVLRDVTMTRNEYMIVVNDDKDVTLFIQGTVKIIGGGIITKDYLDLMGVTNAALVSKDEIRDNIAGIGASSVNTNWTNDLVIPQNSVKGDKTYPNVIIYGDANSVLDMYSDSNNLLTALVRAPKLTFMQKLALVGTNAGIDYVNPAGGSKRYCKGASSTENNSIGVIGQLVAGKIVLKNDNKWGLIFIDAGKVTECPCGCPSCDKEHPTKCTCCASGPCCTNGCICTGHLAGYGTPDAYTILNYDFY